MRHDVHTVIVWEWTGSLGWTSSGTGLEVEAERRLGLDWNSRLNVVWTGSRDWTRSQGWTSSETGSEVEVERRLGLDWKSRLNVVWDWTGSRGWMSSTVDGCKVVRVHVQPGRAKTLVMWPRSQCSLCNCSLNGAWRVDRLKWLTSWWHCDVWFCLEADDDDEDFYDAVDDDEKFSFKSALFASEPTSHKSVLTDSRCVMLVSLSLISHLQFSLCF